jgi:sugar phosphate permease
MLAAWLLGEFGFRYSFFGGTLVLSAIWLFMLFNQRDKPEDVGLEPRGSRHYLGPPV